MYNNFKGSTKDQFKRVMVEIYYIYSKNGSENILYLQYTNNKITNKI